MPEAFTLEAPSGLLHFTTEACDSLASAPVSSPGIAHVRNAFSVVVPAQVPLTVAFTLEGLTFMEQASRRLSRLLTGYVEFSDGRLCVAADGEEAAVAGLPLSARVTLWGQRETSERTYLLLALEPQTFTAPFELHYRENSQASWGH